jgi:hypothetical protein
MYTCGRGGTSNLSEFETAVAACLVVQQAGVCMHVMKARFALLQVQAPRLRGRHQVCIRSVPYLCLPLIKKHREVAAASIAVEKWLFNRFLALILGRHTYRRIPLEQEQQEQQEQNNRKNKNKSNQNRKNKNNKNNRNNKNYMEQEQKQ